jgi:hypothetical protein
MFRCGGWGKSDAFCPATPQIKHPGKYVWLIGRLRNCIGIIPALLFGNWIGAIAYALTVEIPYGDNDKNWIRKAIGRDWNWVLYGASFGLTSIFYLPLILALMQGFLAALAFYGLMRWSNDGFQKPGKAKTFLDHSYVEIVFGVFGTILYLFR